MADVERVTFRPEGGRARSLYLESIHEATVLGAPVIEGLEVDAHGEVRWFASGTACRRHLIQAELVIKRTPMRMDNELSQLVEAR